ncbi:MAG: cysteine hydrolase [Burkholderiales bacterium 66-5]|uniref:cysteine hydrolase family protein n=1 Tax=Comamonas badia TaxID=265291 RepID=UPI00041D3377|nr:cysteine hydrolase family protein [Comamonas badia]OJU91747.1 MAG: cysteine hydrolase [Burkholderiales bacterium 66-5]
MSKRAVLVVDLQKEYLPAGKLALVGIEQAVANAVQVIGDARARGELVVHIHHESDNPAIPVFVPGSDGVQFIADVTPQAGEPAVLKHFPNSFLKTDLKSVLDSNGIEEVVIVGAMSQMCIDATARAASDIGYPVTVIHDACATRDLEFGGQSVPAAQVHAAFMSALAFSYARVISCGEYQAAR